MVDMIMLEHIKMICITVFIQQSFFKLYNFSLYYTSPASYTQFSIQISIVVRFLLLSLP